MAIKTIEYKISACGITPAVEQFAGTQGDHCATKISISIDDELYSSVMDNYESSNVLYRFDVYDGEGGIWQSEVKPLEQNLSLWLEERHTRYGGKIMIYLVVAAVSQEKQTEMELYSFPISLRLKNRPQGEYQDGENYESVSALVTQAESSAAEAREFANEVIEKLKNGEFDGKDGVSATHEWNGTVLTIESASGKTSVDLKGEKGDKGDMPDVSGFVLKVKGDLYTDQMYGIDLWGNPITLKVDDLMMFESGAAYQDIPRRKSSGNIMTNTPVDDLDCANKKYVDDKLGDIEILLGGI